MNTLVALCAVGAEKILGNEIKILGYKLLGNAPGRVFFEGDNDALFRANLCLRTADRVYLLVARYKAEDFDQLFDGVYAVEWQDFFKKDSKVTVDKVRTYKSKLNSEHSVQSMVQKAIYKKLCDRWNMSSMPETGNESDVRVYLDNDEALILLDLSGNPLHKRGYRTDGGVAPLRETTAAIMIQMMMWKRKIPLHDPFCGSGTIPIEAALYAFNIAPGFGRRFALENLGIFNLERALELKKIEAQKIRTDVEVRITGTDIDRGAVERARLNAEHACVTAGRALKSIGIDAHVWRPDFQVSDFKDLAAPYESGMLICNPPYGERLGDEQDAAKLYAGMKSLFDDFKGWQIGVITAHKEFQESINRYATTLKSLKSGSLDTTFYIYDGSEKEKKHTSPKKKGERSFKQEQYGKRGESRRDDFAKKDEGQKRDSFKRREKKDEREFF